MLAIILELKYYGMFDKKAYFETISARIQQGDKLKGKCGLTISVFSRDF